MTHDPLDPTHFLDPGETLVWSGRPNPKAMLPSMIRILRIIGWAMAAIFVVFGLIGWASRDELDGTGWIIAFFLASSGLTALGFIVGAPLLYRGQWRNTRYAVTDRHALTVQGGARGEVIRRAVIQKAQIVSRKDYYTVYYAEDQMLNHDAQHGSVHRKRSVAVGFEGLDQGSATLAAAALDQARGKDTGLPINTPLGR